VCGTCEETKPEVEFRSLANGKLLVNYRDCRPRRKRILPPPNPTGVSRRRTPSLKQVKNKEVKQEQAS